MRLAAAVAVATTYAVFAKAQTTNPQNYIPLAPAAAIEAPLVGVSEVIDELRSVSYHRPDGQRTFAVVAEDLVKYFPVAVAETDAGAAIEPGAMVAILLALVKETQETNAHLEDQIAHVITDKAELERRLLDVDAQLAELREEMRDYRGNLAVVMRKRARKEAAAAARH